MIGQLIVKLKEELNNLKLAKEEMEINNKAIIVVNKLLNKVNVSNDELKLFTSFIENNFELDKIEKETLEFIVCMISEKLEYDNSQKNLLLKLKKGTKVADLNFIDVRINKLTLIIEKLESNQIFIYFDDLREILIEYKYNLKDIYNIINLLINKNYNANDYIKNDNFVSIDEFKVTDEYYSPTGESKIYDIQIEPEIEEEKELVEDIIVEEKKDEVEKTTIMEEDRLIYNGSSYTLTEILQQLGDYKIERKQLENLFNKYKIKLNKLPDKYIQILLKSDIDLSFIEKLLDTLVKNKIDVKKEYSKKTISIFKMILFTNEAIFSRIIEIAQKKNISLRKLLKKDFSILYSENYGGHFENLGENFICLKDNNISFTCEQYKLLLCPNYILKNMIEVLFKYYKINNKLSDCLYNACSSSLLINLDRAIELSTDRYYFSEICKMSDNRELEKNEFCYNFKRKSIKIDADKFMGDIDDIPSQVYNMPLKDEKTLSLDKLFIYNSDSPDVLSIPSDVGIDESILENEFVAYIETKKARTNCYDFNGTIVSRPKVLRILTFLKLNDVEITEDIVKYAIKFNYVYVDNDLENIENIFNQKNNERSYVI